MNINALDTNVVFDIIYKKRDRNSVAIDFYKKFKNLELTIPVTVKQECIKVLIKYSTSFATDFNNFLGSQNTLRKHWDDTDITGKTNLIKDFEKGLQNKRDYQVIRPFYENILNKIRKAIVFMTTQNINEFLLELPGTMQEYFVDSMNNMFITIYPNNNAPGYFKTYEKFKELLKEFFDTKESSDFDILLNLIMLILVGDSNNRKIDFINFYTSDKAFKKNYETIFNNKNEICSKIAEDCILNNIKFYSINDKIDVNE